MPLFNLSVTSRNSIIFKFEAISIRRQGNLNALIILCILEILGPLLSGMKIIPSSWYSPTCSKLTIWHNVSMMKIPIKSATGTKLWAPMSTLKLFTWIFTQILRLSDGIDFLHARIISVSSSVMAVYSLAWFRLFTISSQVTDW